MFYIRRCYNCDLAEKVLHHILDKYREERNKEWFSISNELTIYVIDMVCDFLDMFINSSEKLPEYKIKEFLNELPIKKFDITVAFNKKDVYIPEMVYNKEIKNYSKFIDEYCYIDDTEQSAILPYELTGAYRLWCKQALTREMINEFKTYVYTHFKLKDKYFENTGIRHKIITNVKLKTLEFTPDDIQNEKTYETFCLESCVMNYTFKIKISEFIDDYVLWMKKKNSEYEMTNDHLLEIKEYFNKKLTIDNGMIYGIQLNTDKLPNYRIRNLSTIYAINENKEIVNTYNGLADAADKLNLEIKYVSDNIRYSRVIDYEDEKILLIYEKGENLIKKRNVQIKYIYKYDYDTKELLEKFETTKDVANSLEISTYTVLRYIYIAKVFNTKKDGNKKILLSYLNNIDDVKPVEKTKVIKSRPCKKLYTYDINTNKLFIEYEGPYNAACKLNIGQCTVQRHIKNGKPITIVHNNKKTSIIFTYKKLEN